MERNIMMDDDYYPDWLPDEDDWLQEDEEYIELMY